MKITKFIAVTTVAALGFSGAALAGEPQGQASGQGCIATIGSPPTKNPGKFFQSYRDSMDLNPKELAEYAETFPDVDSDKVGDLIAYICDNSPS